MDTYTWNLTRLNIKKYTYKQITYGEIFRSKCTFILRAVAATFLNTGNTYIWGSCKILNELIWTKFPTHILLQDTFSKHEMKIL